jgi:hypothetical protein
MMLFVSVHRPLPHRYEGALYRGININRSVIMKQKYDAYETAFAVGTKLALPAPTACSTSDNIADYFTAGMQLCILKAVSVSLDYNQLSANDESEVILPFPSTFDFVARSKVQDTVIVPIEPIPSAVSHCSVPVVQADRDSFPAPNSIYRVCDCAQNFVKRVCAESDKKTLWGSVKSEDLIRVLWIFAACWIFAFVYSYCASIYVARVACGALAISLVVQCVKELRGYKNLVLRPAAALTASLRLTAARQLIQTAPSLHLSRAHQCFVPHTMFLAIIMSDSSSVPAAPAPAVKSSSARCQLVTVESRCPCDARRWPRMTLAIAMLSSVCYVSAAQGTWSTAQLSVARKELAATSVGNVAIFAGGKCCCWCFCLGV